MSNTMLSHEKDMLNTVSLLGATTTVSDHYK